MEVVYLKSFSKDLDKINNKKLKESLLELIENCKSANSISELAGSKRLVGFRTAYRIRVGNYRVGVFFEDNCVTFARVLHRKDIYKLFP
ncbi:MAG: type II toxin-antitoxin system RelE/ParE family toxin [Cytophagia bacterium]|nr:type II toxin-antitoxin system RelE/ParE family toxin [Cytophagia bacterium]